MSSYDYFNDLWAEKRADLYSKFAFVEQYKLKDIDFVCGYVYYILAHQAKSNNDPQHYIDYLKKAVRHNSIHSAQTLLHDFIMEERCNKNDTLEDGVALLNNWSRLAEVHGTPGYLLLANGYLHLVRGGSELQHSDLYEHACLCLWKNLTLAELYESHSEDSIKNAYFGQGLALSNPFKITTIEVLKEKCETLVPDISLRERAEEQAHHSFENHENYQIRMWTNKKKEPHYRDINHSHGL